jgi:hypothetical protein
MALPDGARFVVLRRRGSQAGNKFAFTGSSDARSPTPEEDQDALRRTGVMRGEANVWTPEQKAEARRLWAEERLSWAQIAERVCGDRRFKSTVQGWL